MITLICGVAGKGKTALATQLALRNAKRGMELFSNYNVSWKTFGLEQSANILEPLYFKERAFPECSYIIIDECQNQFNSRYFKDMSKEEMEYFTGHRHLGNELVLTTPMPDRVDIVLRVCVENFIWIRHALPFGIKICYLYYKADDVGRLPPEVPKDFVKLRIYRVSKDIYTKYDDKYLKDKFKRTSHKTFPQFIYKRSKYIPALIRTYRAINKQFQYYKKIYSIVKEQKALNKKNKLANLSDLPQDSILESCDKNI